MLKAPVSCDVGLQHCQTCVNWFCASKEDILKSAFSAECTTQRWIISFSFQSPCHHNLDTLNYLGVGKQKKGIWEDQALPRILVLYGTHLTNNWFMHQSQSLKYPHPFASAYTCTPTWNMHMYPCIHTHVLWTCIDAPTCTIMEKLLLHRANVATTHYHQGHMCKTSSQTHPIDRSHY